MAVRAGVDRDAAKRQRHHRITGRQRRGVKGLMAVVFDFVPQMTAGWYYYLMYGHGSKNGAYAAPHAFSFSGLGKQ
ncbi:hypothetical protein KCP76_23900 [Salmonella enterica subsp. enterica serovar Weltevreden]|nr:hypothetical protein KCP76_23900 [Salmonella enterica subsp. enterica serovar Weltevreden]